MPDTNDLTSLGSDVAAIRARSAALRQAAGLPRAKAAELLTAALAELDSALVALAADADGSAGMATAGTGQRSAAAQHAQQSDRRLLQAVFAQAPVPLLVIDQEGTIRRANAAACELLGVGQGYATGKPLTSLIEPTARAAVRSQLASVARTGKSAKLGCRLVTRLGVIDRNLAVSALTVRGDANRILVAIGQPQTAAPEGPAGRRADGAGRRKQADARSGTDLATSTRRFDLLSSAATLLLENAASSESVILQRCARLLADGLASWVIVDLHRRNVLRRHFVASPDERRSATLANVIVAIEPAPESVPHQVCESGSSVLLSHADDESALGAGPDGVGLLTLLDASCVLSVPLLHGARKYGVLTLARPSAEGQFSLAEVGLVEEICGLLSRAMSARRTLRRHTDAAEALSASLLPPVLRTVPGVEIASAHMPPTRGRAVGGDFYDVYPTKAGWGVAIGDVCGKGEDAAAATAAARHAIRVLGHWNDDPADVLRGANEIMLAEQFGGRFVTAAVLHLSWRDRALQAVLATAGHPGPVLLRGEEGARLTPGGGLPLGIFPEPEAASQAMDLQRGDVLFFFTDGLTGARSPKAESLEDSLADILAEKAQRHPAEIVSDMREHVIDFCGGVLLDDLSMLALRVAEPPGP
jgi:serine phosphatase RsbU (regulator of sigma subunit)/PAS domain-containing protein